MNRSFPFLFILVLLIVNCGSEQGILFTYKNQDNENITIDSTRLAIYISSNDGGTEECLGYKQLEGNISDYSIFVPKKNDGEEILIRMSMQFEINNETKYVTLDQITTMNMTGVSESNIKILQQCIDACIQDEDIQNCNTPFNHIKVDCTEESYNTIATDCKIN